MLMAYMDDMLIVRKHEKCMYQVVSKMGLHVKQRVEDSVTKFLGC